MNLYKGEYWNVVFGSWCQEFPGYCIIGNEKESLSDLEPEAWIELGKIEKELERVCKKVIEIIKNRMYIITLFLDTKMS